MAPVKGAAGSHLFFPAKNKEGRKEPKEGPISAELTGLTGFLLPSLWQLVLYVVMSVSTCTLPTLLLAPLSLLHPHPLTLDRGLYPILTAPVL